MYSRKQLHLLLKYKSYLTLQLQFMESDSILIINFAYQFYLSSLKFSCTGTCKVFGLGEMMASHFVHLPSNFQFKFVKEPVILISFCCICCAQLYILKGMHKNFMQGKILIFFSYFIHYFDGFQLMIKNLIIFQRFGGSIPHPFRYSLSMY